MAQLVITSRLAPFRRAGFLFASVREPLVIEEDPGLTQEQLMRLAADPALTLKLVDGDNEQTMRAGLREKALAALAEVEGNPHRHDRVNFAELSFVFEPLTLSDLAAQLGSDLVAAMNTPSDDQAAGAAGDPAGGPDGDGSGSTDGGSSGGAGGGEGASQDGKALEGSPSAGEGNPPPPPPAEMQAPAPKPAKPPKPAKAPKPKAASTAEGVGPEGQSGQ